MDFDTYAHTCMCSADNSLEHLVIVLVMISLCNIALFTSLALQLTTLGYDKLSMMAVIPTLEICNSTKVE